MREDFTPYEIAYLCGGPERVVMVAIAGLHADGLIRITRKGHRVAATTHTARDPFEAAVFDALPSAGRVLGEVISRVSESPAVLALCAALVEEELTDADFRHPGLQRAQRHLRTRLRTEAAETGPARIAALGSAGITEPALREVFETPDPQPVKLFSFRRGTRRTAGRSGRSGNNSGLDFLGDASDGDHSGGGGGCGGAP
jgi:hypothetical protein